MITNRNGIRHVGVDQRHRWTGTLNDSSQHVFIIRHSSVGRAPDC